MIGTLIDSVRDVGLLSTLKGYLLYNQNDSTKLEISGWFAKKKRTVPQGKETQYKAIARDGIIADIAGNFDVMIPLKLLMGFFEDYRKLIIHMR